MPAKEPGNGVETSAGQPRESGRGRADRPEIAGLPVEALAHDPRAAYEWNRPTAAGEASVGDQLPRMVEQRRLRSVVWKQWKRGKRRFSELRLRDVGEDLAARTAGSPHGPWRLARSPAPSFALPNAYFQSLGLPTLVVRPTTQPAEPPCTDPYARWCNRDSPRGLTYVDKEPI